MGLGDGANGTPDLRDRFVAGAGSTYVVGGSGGAATHSHARGTYASPSHLHSVSGTVDA